MLPLHKFLEALSMLRIYVTLACFLLALTPYWSQNHQGQQTKTEKAAQHHGHNHSSHEGHNHDHHNHEGHNHSSHQGHNHGSHEGHDHSSHSGHNHGSHDGHDHGAHEGHDDHGHHGRTEPNNWTKDCGEAGWPTYTPGYDPTATAIHHISDANVYTIMDMIRIPLPMIIYDKEHGMEFFSSGKFDAGHHDNGHYGYKDYVLYEGNVHKITCPNFNPPSDKYEVDGFDKVVLKDDTGKEYDKRYAIINDKGYLLEQKTIWDGGLLGGGVTSFYDLSPTKNVVSMGLVSMLLFFLFRAAAKKYSGGPSAPSGVQSFLEPMFQFIRDDVAIPFLGDKHEKFLPLLMTIFCFILGLNLWGQVPFLGNVNVTGSLTVTAVMAVLVFIITNIKGNGDYWKHILWPPDTPLFVKIILIPVEIMGMFIKPLTLMLRLAGNISAGHIAILSFVGLIFIFGKAGASLGGSLTGTAIAVPLTLFMMAIELIVAFIQAFVFTILTASYLGAATEEPHHDDHH